jgi:hypothetical protein
MSNIAEGFERDSEPDRLRFYSIAKASCAEVRSQLYIALDAGYLDQAKLNTLMSKATEIGRVIGGLRSAITRDLRSTNGKKRVSSNGLVQTQLVARCSLLVARNP